MTPPVSGRNNGIGLLQFVLSMTYTIELCDEKFERKSVWISLYYTHVYTSVTEIDCHRHTWVRKHKYIDAIGQHSLIYGWGQAGCNLHNYNVERWAELAVYQLQSEFVFYFLWSRLTFHSSLWLCQIALVKHVVRSILAGKFIWVWYFTLHDCLLVRELQDFTIRVIP